MGALAGTPLGRAALLLVAADVAHALDHTRQGRDLAAEVYTAGVAGWIALGLLLVLVGRRHRLAAAYAAAVGLSVAVGFVLVHALERVQRPVLRLRRGRAVVGPRGGAGAGRAQPRGAGCASPLSYA
jgi:predicted lysophospholipase L1 biosynthesis ABC-type transport system permease subunit